MAVQASPENLWSTLRDRASQPVHLRVSLSWLVAGGSLALLMLAWCAATTGYALFHDETLRDIVERHRTVQRGSQADITRLKAEMERLTTGYLVEKSGWERQMEALAQRQEALEVQQQSLSGIVGSRPASTLRGASQDQSGLFDTVPLQGRFKELTARYDQLDRNQKAITSTLANQVTDERARLASAYASLGLPPMISAPVKAGLGGPFIAMESVSGSPLAPEMDRLARQSQERDRLRAALEKLPVRAPLPVLEITSGFGGRPDPFLGASAFHSGIDFRSSNGAPVRPSAAGTVVSAGWNGGYGLMVEIRHADGLSTRYAHLSAVATEAGQHVEPGDVIGQVGSTGRSTGAHLHYEVRRGDQAINPDRFLAAGKALNPS